MIKSNFLLEFYQLEVKENIRLYMKTYLDKYCYNYQFHTILTQP